ARTGGGGRLTMVGRVRPSLRARADRLKRHPSWLVRRSAQMVILGVLVSRLAPWSQQRAGDDGDAHEVELMENRSFTQGVREYIRSRGVLRLPLGLLARLLTLLEAADARSRELARSDHRAFVLRVGGTVDQGTLRNLLIWQNHVLAAL